MNSTNEDYDYRFKICLAGDSTVGKTSFLSRYSRDEFQDEVHTTIGADFYSRTLQIKNFIVKLLIWDTAGQERFRAITSAYYRGAVGMMIFYDVTNRNSFTNIDKWHTEIVNHADLNKCTLLVGNKCDLESQRQVSKEEGELKAKELGCKFVETSAKDTINIASTLTSLAEDIFAAEMKQAAENPLSDIAKSKPDKYVKKLSEEKVVEKYAACC